MPRTNSAHVEIRWSFRCGDDDPVDASFAYTIKLTRLLPRPVRTRTLTSGTAPVGRTRVRLTPGVYRADANPFQCTAGSASHGRGVMVLRSRSRDEDDGEP